MIFLLLKILLLKFFSCKEVLINTIFLTNNLKNLRYIIFFNCLNLSAPLSNSPLV